MNQGWRYENQIASRDVGKTVLEFYRQFTHSTPQEWTARICSGQILLDGQLTTPDTRLQLHQQLIYHRQPWEEPSVPLDLPVLYQDEALWVINKPSGLPVLPGGAFLEHTVVGQLRCQYPRESLVPIHRLGRGTSGLLLLARTPQARAELSQQMRDRLITKRYRALVGPGVPSEQFTITQPIGKCAYPQLGYLYCASSVGKSAKSTAIVLKRTSETTLLEVKITTGRPHQIRIHLAYYGFPLLGDPLYDIGGKPYPPCSSGSAIPSDCGYHLHSDQLQFRHPITGQTVYVQAPNPEVLTL